MRWLRARAASDAELEKAVPEVDTSVERRSRLTASPVGTGGETPRLRVETPEAATHPALPMPRDAAAQPTLRLCAGNLPPPA
jgi:hypothetical protein